MNVLVLGGTRFVGRHIALALLAGGHRVTVLNRGCSPDALPDAVERLRGDRDAPALEALADRVWDACVDVSGYTPRQVRASVGARVGRYVFVSAVSVYGDPQARPVVEGHPRLAPCEADEVTAETYGPLKVACEDVVADAFGDRAAILRPQIVVGPHDPENRYAHWVRRAAAGGPMLAPGDGTDHVQVVDVRDVARFARTVVERDLAGPFNLAGPRLTWADFLRVLGARDLVWVGAERLAGLTFRELPLYRPERGPRSGLMDVSSARALAAGLTLTDPAVTARDTRAWLGDGAWTPALPPALEAALLAT